VNIIKYIIKCTYLLIDFNYLQVIVCFVLVCKILAEELEGRLLETGKTSEYLEIGYSIDLPKKKKEYKKS